MSVHKDYIYSYGHDQRLVKFNFKTKALDSFIELDHKATAFKLLKTPMDDSATGGKFKLALSFNNGEISLFDLSLNMLITV